MSGRSLEAARALRRIAYAMLVCGLAGTPCRAEEAGAPANAAAQPSPVVVRIGDFSMTLAELEDLWGRLTPETKQYWQDPGHGGKRGFVDEFVRKKLIAMDAETRGIHQRPEVRLSLLISQDTILYDEYLRDRLRELISPERQQAYYDAHRAELAVPLRVHVRHIVVTPRADKTIPNLEQDDATDEAAAQAKLQKIREKLNAGEQFVEVAQQLSEDRSAGSGGDLGFVEPGQLLPVLDSAAFTLKEGERSDVLRSEQGYHILFVEERQEAGVPPLDEVRDDILDALGLEAGESLQKDLDARIADLRTKVQVQIDESQFGTNQTAPPPKSGEASGNP